MSTDAVLGRPGAESAEQVSCAPGVFLHSVSQLLDQLRNSEPPREVRRMSEAVSGWRPIYEELLELLAETRLDSWPFQQFPGDWRERVETLLTSLDRALAHDLVCHYPQRAGSNLRRLASAAADPAALSGREVALIRRIMLDSEARHGRIGSPARRATRESRDDPAAFFRAAREQLVQRLEKLEPTMGIEDVEGLLDGLSLPASLAQRVRRCRQASLAVLMESGAVETFHEMAQIMPQLMRAARRPGAPQRQLAQEILREVLGLIWEHFPAGEWPDPVARLFQDLWPFDGAAPISSLSADQDAAGPVALIRRTAKACAGTPYERYYGLPVSSLLGMAPGEPGQPLKQHEVWELARRRALSRGISGSDPPPAQIIEELRLLTCDGLWCLATTLRPAMKPLSSARSCLEFALVQSQRTCPRTYQARQRHKRVARAWQRMLFFLSQAEPEARTLFLDEAAARDPRVASWLRPFPNNSDAATVLTAWCP